MLKKILVGACALAMLDLVGSTIYYNFADPNLARLRQELMMNGEDETTCMQWGPDAIECGDAVAQRDFYLRLHHVWAVGPWDAYGNHTFQIYFNHLAV